MALIPVAKEALGGDIVQIASKGIMRAQALAGGALSNARRQAALAQAQNDLAQPGEAITPVRVPQDPYIERVIVIAQGIPVSVRTQEAFTYEAEVTQHAVENGSPITDHVILKPLKIDLSFEITNFDRDKAQYCRGLLEKAFLAREPLELLTEHGNVLDMVMTSFGTVNSVPNWGALICRASFTQIKLLTIETVAFPKTKVAKTAKALPATPAGLTTPVDNGRTGLQDTTAPFVN